jgi:hypothetical protein
VAPDPGPADLDPFQPNQIKLFFHKTSIYCPKTIENHDTYNDDEKDKKC